MRRFLALFSILACTCQQQLSCVQALPRSVKRIPNGANVPGIKALGHVDPNGAGPRNVFGDDFQKAGFMWTIELCEQDSDGDGQTNGQELGDPCCSWSETGYVTYIRGISHPADPTDRVDPRIFENIQCTQSTERSRNSKKKNKKTTTSSDASSSGSGLSNSTAVDGVISINDLNHGNRIETASRIVGTMVVLTWAWLVA